MKKFIIFLAIFCIRFGFSGGNIFAQTTTDFINDGTSIVEREIKIIKKYPAPTKNADPIEVVNAINNGGPYVEHFLHNSIIWGLTYVDKIYPMEYPNIKWKEPVIQEVHSTNHLQIVIICLCAIFFLIGFFWGKELYFKNYDFLICLVFSLIFLIYFDSGNFDVYNNIVYQKEESYTISALLLILCLYGIMTIGRLIKKTKIFKK